MVVNRLGRLAALWIGLGALCGLSARAGDALGDVQGTVQGIALFRSGRFAEAYRGWILSAEAGDGRAARFLGVMYDSGEGVTQDRRQAMHWYQRAAELGDAGGMFNMAVSYDAGLGVPQDHVTAAQWYARAAARHFGRAEYNLALMYQDGDGVRRDPAAAQRLFRDAAGDGIAAARTHLAVRREVTLRSPPSDDALFRDAQRALLSRRPEDAARAAALFRQAAVRDDVAGQMSAYDLAWCYENGIGVTADRTEAYALYIHVAATAHDPALRSLAEAGALGMQDRAHHWIERHDLRVGRRRGAAIHLCVERRQGVCGAGQEQQARVRSRRHLRNDPRHVDPARRRARRRSCRFGGSRDGHVGRLRRHG